MEFDIELLKQIPTLLDETPEFNGNGSSPYNIVEMTSLYIRLSDAAHALKSYTELKKKLSCHGRWMRKNFEAPVIKMMTDANGRSLTIEEFCDELLKTPNLLSKLERKSRFWRCASSMRRNALATAILEYGWLY